MFSSRLHKRNVKGYITTLLLKRENGHDISSYELYIWPLSAPVRVEAARPKKVGALLINHFNTNAQKGNASNENFLQDMEIYKPTAHSLLCAYKHEY